MKHSFHVLQYSNIFKFEIDWHIYRLGLFGWAVKSQYLKMLELEMPGLLKTVSRHDNPYAFEKKMSGLYAVKLVYKGHPRRERKIMALLTVLTQCGYSTLKVLYGGGLYMGVCLYIEMAFIWGLSL